MTTLSTSPTSPFQVLPVETWKPHALFLGPVLGKQNACCAGFNLTQLKSCSMLQTNVFENTLRRSSNMIAWSLIVLFNYVKTI